MIVKTRAAGAALLLLVSLAACQDQPAASTPAAELPAVQTVLAELRCEANVSAGTLSCQGAQGSAGGARRTLVTVGGQHQFVRLANAGTTTGPGTFSTTVTVQNLLLAALGTADGSTADSAGVRVVFASEPTNGVTVANASGQEIFLSSSQDYFRYSGAELGTDGILASDEISAGKVWTFNTGEASGFAFTVYVQAEVPAGTDHTARFTQVSTAPFHTCALTAAGKAYCWGSDGSGRLGNGDALTGNQGVPSAVQMPAGVTFTRIATGNLHACALGSNGLAYCWAQDGAGQLGNGTTLTGDQTAPSPVEMPTGVTGFSGLSAGANHTCAMGSDNQAYCWGSDSLGQLGNGSTLTASQAAPSPVQMPAGVTGFSGFAAGASHTCAIGSDDQAYCWGSDSSGQLGNGSAVTANQAAPSPVQLPAGVTGFSGLSAGSNHTCGIGSDNRAYCWGNDASGQLGNGSAATAIQVAPSQVQVPAGVTGFASISAGGNHTCAVASDGQAFCWGLDGSGQLGNGTAVTAIQVVPSQVQLPAGVTGFASISAGPSHSCALMAGPTYCWGLNSGRQVGDGTFVGRVAPVVVAGTR